MLKLGAICRGGYRVLEWQNFLKHPELPTLRVLASPPGPLARSMLIGRWLFLGLALVAEWKWLRSRRRWHAGVAAALVIVSVASFLVGRNAALSDNRARQVVADLLHNVYRAFDFRDEEQIYDTLERSVDGDLLAQIYLETRRGLELANQGGARDLVFANEAGRPLQQRNVTNRSSSRRWRPQGFRQA